MTEEPTEYQIDTEHDQPIEKVLFSALGSLEDAFRPNELAYLALTTKIELPLRDRWAYSLYERLGRELVVAREWKRTDLAILKGQWPIALVELKAMYTFDAAHGSKNFNQFVVAVEKDLKKAKELAEQGTDIFAVLLATHPKHTVPKELFGVIKYAAGINGAIEKAGAVDGVKESATKAIDKQLQRWQVVHRGVLVGGEAFKIPTEILYWVV